MKNICKNILCLFSFVFALFMVNEFSVNAKSSSNEVFEITVGDNKLPLYYTLVENQIVYNESKEVVGNLESNIISMGNGDIYELNNNNIYVDGGEEIVGRLNEAIITMNNGEVYTLGEVSIQERIQFNVYVKGLSETLNEYKWEHKLCYKIEGYNEICEIDITGEDSNNKITSQGEYSYYFYDGHMPYYSETLNFEYVIFKNKFIVQNCNSNTEFSLVDINFNESEINYKYSYDMSVDYVTVGNKQYVGDDTDVAFINNSASRLNYSQAPMYNFIYEVCVESNKCIKSETDKVYSGGMAYSITPYIGNISFSFDISELIKDAIEVYETATYRIVLKCIDDNCSSRRVSEDVVIEKSFSLDYIAPIVDENNTIINSSNDAVNYIKNSELKITFKENESGLDLNSLKYYIIKPAYNSCNYYSSKDEYSFVNGDYFIIGENLNGGYCMYYAASDNYGNKYTSNYFVFYFDNKGPVMSFDSVYDESKYYNSIELSPIFNDNQSNVKEVYYLWSKEVINEENYIIIKNDGKLFNESINIEEINEDGKYYLYVLAYDNLDNYSFNDFLGGFNIDKTGLVVEDVVIVGIENIESYSNVSSIVVSVSEMDDNESYLCAFNEDVITENSLVSSCNNNQTINFPSGLEGEYNLFVKVRDRANNITILKLLEGVKVDTKAPNIDYDVLHDDNEYHLTNEIKINVSDINGVNESSLKYGWFLTSEINVVGSSLTNSFENDKSFGYPVNKYGEYKLYVSALDDLGNELFISLDKVFKIDTDVIHISLMGEETVTILRGETYMDSGAFAYKGELTGGNRTSEVNVSGNVDSNKSGVYYITYSSGEGDLLVSVTRKIIVKSDNRFIIIGLSLFGLGTTITCLRLFIRRKKR